MKSLADYESLMSDRPRKFTPSDVGYREATALVHRCRRCIHFYSRIVDRFGVCEIMRPSADEPVDPDYVCVFQTKDGDTFPLLDAKQPTTESSSKGDSDGEGDFR